MLQGCQWGDKKGEDKWGDKGKDAILCKPMLVNKGRPDEGRQKKTKSPKEHLTARLLRDEKTAGLGMSLQRINHVHPVQNLNTETKLPNC